MYTQCILLYDSVLLENWTYQPYPTKLHSTRFVTASFLQWTHSLYAPLNPPFSLKADSGGHVFTIQTIHPCFSHHTIMTIVVSNWLVLVTVLSLVLLGRFKFSRNKSGLVNLPGPVSPSWLRGKHSHGRSSYWFNPDVVLIGNFLQIFNPHAWCFHDSIAKRCETSSSWEDTLLTSI